MRAEAEGRGEVEGKFQAKTLDHEDDDHGAVLDLHPPTHGVAGIVWLQGLERLAILLYSPGFTAQRETSHPSG